MVSPCYKKYDAHCGKSLFQLNAKLRNTLYTYQDFWDFWDRPINWQKKLISLFPITELVCKCVGHISAYTETIKKTVSNSGGRIALPIGRILPLLRETSWVFPKFDALLVGLFNLQSRTNNKKNLWPFHSIWQLRENDLLFYIGW